MTQTGRLRFPVAETQGRRYPEPPHPYRSEFQRDRDRIVHARAFRRLENKTQVFAPGLSDHFRNRLTHSIEVSQIARTVASVLDLDEDLTEALALGHDIGHPPFAHAGEEELDRQMRVFGEGFDHNLHALRIVDTLESPYARFPGLNLTYEVREGIVKHSRDLDPDKDCALAEYHPGERPPLEAQLIDLADEIAYNTADLDDTFAAGMLSFEDARASVTAFRELADRIEMQFPGASEQVQFLEIVRALVDQLVSGLVRGTAEACQNAGVFSGQEVRQYGTRLARFTSEAAQTNRELKALLHRTVYHSEALIQERRISTRRIGEMFQLFLREPGWLPEHFREENPEIPVHRMVCDYIAGMTDGFFQRTYEQLL